MIMRCFNLNIFFSKLLFTFTSLSSIFKLNFNKQAVAIFVCSHLCVCLPGSDIMQRTSGFYGMG